MIEFCARCRFWEFMWQPEHDDPMGECRRHAPRPHAYVLEEISRSCGLAAWAAEEQANVEHQSETAHDYLSESTESYRVNEWPITTASAWCGEFEAHEPAKYAPREQTFARLKAIEAWLKDHPIVKKDK